MFALLDMSQICHSHQAYASTTNTKAAEAQMRAHQIMTRSVITVTPETTIVDAAKTMLQRHISGLPVVDTAGKLVGI